MDSAQKCGGINHFIHINVHDMTLTGVNPAVRLSLPVHNRQAASVTLTSVGESLITLFEQRNFQAIAQKFGYAVAFGRNLRAAISADIDACITESLVMRPGTGTKTNSIASSENSLTITFFEPNDNGFYAEIECTFEAQQHCAVAAVLSVFHDTETANIDSETLNVVISLEDINPVYP
jgi:hypothetical protein